MRNLKILLVLASAIIIFASCNTEYAEPKISLDAPSGEVVDFSEYDEKPVLFNVVVEAEAGIDDLRVERYDYVGEEFSNTLTILVDNEDGWKGATNYEFTFDQPISKSDFENDVTKIEFEFIVKDAEGLTATTSYTITQTAYFTVTFEVKDGNGDEIENAVVTFNDETNEAGDYTFNNVYSGNYSYSVVKEGYIDVTGNINVSENTIVAIELLQGLGEYSGDIILRHSGQTWANYNGTAATHVMTAPEIGVQFPSSGYTAASTLNIETTENCEGWVVVEDGNFNYYHELVAAYNDGTVVTALSITVPDVGFEKSFSELYFIAKIDGDFVLVHNKDGIRHGSNGNVLVFSYKTLD